MSNETYRLARQAILEARAGKRNSCLIFVRPSYLGKTHTAHIICRDLSASIIPVMSVSEQRQWFAERIDDPIFILDDPSDWYIYMDRFSCFSILKNLMGNYVKGARATKFDYNVPLPFEKKVCILLFMNEEQYNMVRKDLVVTGLGARAEVYFTKHNEKTIEKIRDHYARYQCNSSNLPRFVVDDLAGFDPRFLRSMKDKRYFDEEIEFEAPKSVPTAWVKGKIKDVKP